MVIHCTLLTDVHAQLEPVVTTTLPLLPVDGTSMLVVERVAEQLLAAWLTVTIWPATVIVPVRAAPVEFAATVKFDEPSPVMEAPLVTVIQATLLTAVHWQLDPVVTEILPFVPVDGALTVSGATVAAQLLAA